MRKGLPLVTSLILTTTPLAYAQDAPAAAPFAMTSTATLDQGALPVLYTCDGKDISLELAWTGQPAKTQAYALVMTDPDAPGGEFYHWILYNMPKATKELEEGVSKLPSGTLVGKNSFDKQQYNGPCPPKGAAHTYVITLYALSGKVSLPAGKDGKAVLAAIKSNTIGSATFTTTYSRWAK